MPNEFKMHAVIVPLSSPEFPLLANMIGTEELLRKVEHEINGFGSRAGFTEVTFKR
jgi:hypothetical protein